VKNGCGPLLYIRSKYVFEFKTLETAELFLPNFTHGSTSFGFKFGAYTLTINLGTRYAWQMAIAHFQFWFSPMFINQSLLLGNPY
jgi:hypothetical protein